ncbi:MAG: DUF3761 domain-containing protein [Candidatus Pacebacteria bacterium]|nr:DUF3761 domain-containing protein [Candidatus Paceibacterota bacterium]
MEQNNSNQKSWYKKKRYLIPLAIFGLILVIGSNNNFNSQTKSESTTIPSYGFDAPAYQSTNSLNNLSVPQLKTQTTTSTDSNPLSNNNYYTNVNGNTVHSPAYPTNSNSVPVGASAQCRDGTYSFSQNRRGTCSHHGGVAQWL